MIPISNSTPKYVIHKKPKIQNNEYHNSYSIGKIINFIYLYI